MARFSAGVPSQPGARHKRPKQTRKPQPPGPPRDRAPGQPEGRLSARRGDDSVPARSPWAYPPRGPQSRVRAGAASPAVLGGPSSSQRLERAARVHRAPGELCGRRLRPGGSAGSRKSRRRPCGCSVSSTWLLPGLGVVCVPVRVCVRARTRGPRHACAPYTCMLRLTGQGGDGAMAAEDAERAARHPHGGTAARVRARKAAPQGQEAGRPAGLTLIAQLPPVRARIRPGFWFPGETPRGGAGAPACRPSWDLMIFRRGPPPRGQGERPRGGNRDLRGPAQPTCASPHVSRSRGGAPRELLQQPQTPESAVAAARLPLPEPRREPLPAADLPAAPQAGSQPARHRCGRSNHQSLEDSGARGGEAGAPQPGREARGRGGQRSPGEPPHGRESPRRCNATGAPPALGSLLGFPTALWRYAQQKQASVFFFDSVFYVASLSGFPICDGAPFKIIFLMPQFHNHRCLGGETGF